MSIKTESLYRAALDKILERESDLSRMKPGAIMKLPQEMHFER